MSRIIFKDVLAIVDHYNNHVTYSKNFKCKVLLSLHHDCWYMPGLCYAKQEYKLNLWEYVKLKNGVYRRIHLGMRVFYRLDEIYIFMESLTMNNCNFDNIKLYRTKEKEKEST